MKRLINFLFGKYPVPKFKVGDVVSYPSEMFQNYTTNKSSILIGTVTGIHKLSRGIDPYYWVESPDLKIDGKILPLGLPECKLQ